MVDWLQNHSNICENKKAFSAYAPIESKEELFIANIASIKIEESKKVFLKMIFSKVSTLTNVLHVSTVKKNLISSTLLVKKERKNVCFNFKKNIYIYN